MGPTGRAFLVGNSMCKSLEVWNHVLCDGKFRLEAESQRAA